MRVDFIYQTYNEDDTPLKLDVCADVLFYPYSPDDPPDIEVDIKNLIGHQDGRDYLKSLPDFVIDKIEEQAVQVAWEEL